jgi:Holliday junction resolvase RusA-like endonuclease
MNPFTGDTLISFFVPGVPAPGGSKRSFRHRHTGKIVTMDDCERNKSWRTSVAWVAAQSKNGRGDWPRREPLLASFVFVMPRPKGHYGARGLRPSAPKGHQVKPDLTKLIRSTEDALTGILWVDDAQIVRFVDPEKRYAGEGESPGAWITLWSAG